MRNYKLTPDEKYFIACFLEKKHVQLKPNYKHCISLYTYLDDTNEDLIAQKLQITSNDIELVKWLNIVRKNPKNKSIKSYITSEIKIKGYLENKAFKSKLEIIFNWLDNTDDVNVYTRKIKEKLNSLEKNKPLSSNQYVKIAPPPQEKENSQEKEEIAFLEKAYRSNNSNYPSIIVPNTPFCTEFESESRFFAAIVSFQLKQYPHIPIDTPNFFHTWIFKSNELTALDRWTRKYEAIRNGLEVKKTNEQNIRNEKIRRSLERNLKYEDHVTKLLKNKKSKGPTIAGRGSVNDDWGRSTRPKLSDIENDWREQK